MKKVDKCLRWIIDNCKDYERAYIKYGYPLASLEIAYEILNEVKNKGVYTCLLYDDTITILNKFNIPYTSDVWNFSLTIKYC